MIDKACEAFESWWEAYERFRRAGGGNYEKEFAYAAWSASYESAEMPKLPEPDSRRVSRVSVFTGDPEHKGVLPMVDFFTADQLRTYGEQCAWRPQVDLTDEGTKLKIQNAPLFSMAADWASACLASDWPTPTPDQQRRIDETCAQFRNLCAFVNAALEKGTGSIAPGELDPRTATESAQKMIAYCQSFNGQAWGGFDESVDRKNLAVALDNLEETASMLLNMAERVKNHDAAIAADRAKNGRGG